MWDDRFYIDHVFPFGLSPAGGILGVVVDAVVDIFKATLTHIDIEKWVDDVVFMRYPTSSTPDHSYAYSFEQIDAISADLGVP